MRRAESPSARAELKVLLYPKEMFEQMADELGISRDAAAQSNTNAGEKPAEQLPLDYISPLKWQPCRQDGYLSEKIAYFWDELHRS